MLEDSAAILSHANQALATLERYKRRLDEVSGALSALEIEDLATVRDVTAVAQRLEMIRRIAAEIEGYMVELGTDGRLLALHLDELVAGTGQERVMLARDYVPAPPQARADAAAAALARLERPAARRAPRRGGGRHGARVRAAAEALDDLVSPHGYRLLARVPRIPPPAVASLIEHFGGLQKLLAAGVEDLHQVEGVGAAHARSVREGLSRIAEASIHLERYV